MRSKKNIISALFKIFICLSAVLGVLIECGLFRNKLDLSALSYFTVMSNIGCAIYFAAAAVHQYKYETTYLPAVKGALHLCITITGIVYHAMLGGKFEMNGVLWLSNLLLHTVVPVAANLNWLVFDEKGKYTWKMAFAWLLAPLVYTIFANVAVWLGATLGPYHQRYPYYFMDPAQVGGIGMVILIDVIMGICFLILGMALVAIDRWMGRKRTVAA